MRGTAVTFFLTSASRRERPILAVLCLLPATQHQRGVEASESEGIRYGGICRLLPARRYVGQFARRVWSLEVGGWRQPAAVERERGDGRLYRAAGPERVAMQALGTADRSPVGRCSQRAPDRDRLGRVTGANRTRR